MTPSKGQQVSLFLLAFAMKANIDSEEMQGVKRLLEFADFDFSILDKIV